MSEIDWDHWLKLGKWEIAEAAALITGVPPGHSSGAMEEGTPCWKNLQILSRSEHLFNVEKGGGIGRLSYYVKPSEIVQAAIKLGIAIPDEMKVRDLCKTQW